MEGRQTVLVALSGRSVVMCLYMGLFLTKDYGKMTLIVVANTDRLSEMVRCLS